MGLKAARDISTLTAGCNASAKRRDLLHRPQIVADLPAGGKRLSQKSKGYIATIVSGTITYRLRDGACRAAPFTSVKTDRHIISAKRKISLSRVPASGATLAR